MIGRVAMVALAVGLSACAGLEPAGRNAARSPRPTTTASAPAPTPRPVAATPAPAPVQTPPPVVQQPLPAPAATAAPQRVTPPPANPSPSVAAPPVTQPRVTAPPTATATTPSVAAPRVTAPPSTSPSPTAPRPTSDDEDVIVPGQTQIPAPRGDTRSTEERMADVRAWDQCVMQVQNAFDADPMRPQLTTPEEYCRTSLGMNDRTAVPISRRRR